MVRVILLETVSLAALSLLLLLLQPLLLFVAPLAGALAVAVAVRSGKVHDSTLVQYTWPC